MIGGLRTAVVIAVPVSLALHAIDAADIWIHLAAGRFIAAHGWPAQDPFSAPPQPPWLAHDGLASLVLWATHAATGPAGLVVLSAMACAGALVLPLALARRDRLPSLAFECALLAGAFIACERFFVRPEVFTFLFAAIWVQALARGLPRRGRDVVALAALQALWANMHAAFVLGPLLAALAVAGDLVDTRRRERRWRPPGALRALLPVAALAACCVHPYGPGVLAHVLRAGRDVGAGELRRGIAEWQPTFAGPIAGDPTLAVFVMSLAVVAGLAWWGRRRVRGFELLAVLVLAALACTSRRHLALWALVALPCAAAWWARREAARATRGRGVAGAFVLLLALAFALDVTRGRFYARFGPPRQLGFGVSSADHALDAVAFVQREGLGGPLFNNIAAGSLLLERTGTALPVWVDGRLLDAARFRAYRRCLESPAAFDALAAEQDFRLVVLAMQPHPPVRLVRHLNASPAWRLVFLDGEGAVWVRAGVRDDLAALSLDAPLAAAPTGARAGFWNVCDAGEAGRRGLLLHALGYPGAARDDLIRARLHCPHRIEFAAALAREP